MLEGVFGSNEIRLLPSSYGKDYALIGQGGSHHTKYTIVAVDVSTVAASAVGRLAPVRET